MDNKLNPNGQEAKCGYFNHGIGGEFTCKYSSSWWFWNDLGLLYSEYPSIFSINDVQAKTFQARKYWERLRLELLESVYGRYDMYEHAMR